MDDKALREYECWSLVCKQLRAVNAVTEKDLHATRKDTSTPGMLLIQTIREWGKLYADLYR
jgi:hypothetical protein